MSPPDQSSPTPVKKAKPKKPKPNGKANAIKVIGGLIALGLGLFTLLGILGLSIASHVDKNQFTQLATTVIGVVGSIVGAYFGVKVGTDGTQKALDAQRQEAARAQIFAAHLPNELAAQALDLAFPNANGGDGNEGGAQGGDPTKPKVNKTGPAPGEQRQGQPRPNPEPPPAGAA